MSQIRVDVGVDQRRRAIDEESTTLQANTVNNSKGALEERS